jgi:hypothetical protein
MATFDGSYNGLSFGAGTALLVSGWDGVDDLPPVRSTDATRSGEHGAFLGTDLLNERTVTLQLLLLPEDPTPAAARARYDALVQAVATAFAPQNADLPLIYNAGTRRINCRPKRRDIPRELSRSGFSGVATIELAAADPRIYDATLQTLTTGLPTSTGLGTGFPIGFNLGFGGAVSGGFITAVNAGNFPSRPVVTLQGPADNPQITNLTTGQFIKLNLALGATDYLTIDFDAHSILLNGTASRRSSMSTLSQWWELPPGSSQLRWTSDNFYAGALMTVQFRSAWI